LHAVQYAESHEAIRLSRPLNELEVAAEEKTIMARKSEQAAFRAAD
jgi:hypothetical protein